MIARPMSNLVGHVRDNLGNPPFEACRALPDFGSFYSTQEGQTILRALLIENNQGLQDNYVRFQ